jgi:TctA family transporter
MDSFLTLGPSIMLGLSEALQPDKLLYCFLGVFLGMFVGVIPGIGPLAAMSMLFPVTFYLDPTSALIMLAGIYYGTAYGGSTAAILLNVPGTPSGAVASIDGYPMSQAGRGGVALLLTTTSSFIAGSIGILLMMVFSPLIVAFARGFSSAEFFALMLLGLVGASTISSGSAIKGLAMIVLGILFGVVGLDMYTGSERFTFGNLGLTDGINLVVVAMGVFGLTEIIVSARTAQIGSVHKVTLRSMLPTRDDWRRSWLPTLRGSAIGSFFGALPGTGAMISSFMAYAVERRIARDPSRFGKGAVEGICAPEAANNAADQTAFIPTMTLGIPGSATMAIMLGVLMIHGISPGPQLMTERPEMFWGLVMSFWIGNIILVLLNIPLIGLWVRLLQIPYHLLYPAVLMFVCIGVYSVHYSAFDVWLVIGFGLLGYGLRLLDFPAAPLILGFVLGPLLEEHFRRTMIVSRGDVLAMFNRPISGTILAITLAILAWGLVSAWRRSRATAAVSR